MRTKTIPSDWLQSEGCRLDVGPYMSGALEAKAILASLAVPKMPLQDLTLGGMSGLVNAGRIKRVWVTDPDYGRPFLSSTDILQADLSNLRLISNKAVSNNPKLIIRKNWTLITRAGTIGRMAYARPDMDEMACTEDVLRVIPDESKVPPGYLYAYLSSKFGVPLIISGTYGAIIQHIEPHHISDLPVPRLSTEVEGLIHDLVVRSAALRDFAAAKLNEATSALEAMLQPPRPQKNNVGSTYGQTVPVSAVRDSNRLEGFFYNPRALELDRWLHNRSDETIRLGDVASVYDVPQFKHIYVEDDFGTAFFTSGDLFRMERKTDKYLSNFQTKNLRKYILGRHWVLLARSGQLGGIIGRPQFTDSSLQGSATSDHVIRIVPNEKEIPAGYLYAYLATRNIGYSLITRTMTGASIPALWPKFLQDIPVLLCSHGFMKKIDALVCEATEERVKATSIECEARSLVEAAIEEAA